MDRRMKGAVLAFALVVAAAAPATGASTQRTETAAYDRPTTVQLMNTVVIEVRSELPEARPLAPEKSVAIAVTDDSGRPVAGIVYQGRVELGHFCGQTESPLPLISRKPVYVRIFSGPGCADVSVPTAGTIEFTFGR